MWRTQSRVCRFSMSDIPGYWLATQMWSSASQPSRCNWSRPGGRRGQLIQDQGDQGVVGSLDPQTHTGLRVSNQGCPVNHTERLFCSWKGDKSQLVCLLLTHTHTHTIATPNTLLFSCLFLPFSLSLPLLSLSPPPAFYLFSSVSPIYVSLSFTHTHTHTNAHFYLHITVTVWWQEAGPRLIYALMSKCPRGRVGGVGVAEFSNETHVSGHMSITTLGRPTWNWQRIGGGRKNPFIQSAITLWQLSVCPVPGGSWCLLTELYCYSLFRNDDGA